jgi:hypothetical protein
MNDPNRLRWKEQYLMIARVANELKQIAQYPGDADKMEKLENFLRDSVCGNEWYPLNSN